MNITVNNKAENIVSSEKLGDFLLRIHLAEKKGIAVAVNNEVVIKANWGKHTLKENDKITIIQATQGG